MSFGPLDGKTALASSPLGEAPGASSLVGKLADNIVPTAVEMAAQDKIPPAAAQLAQTAIGGLGAGFGTNASGDAPAAAPASALTQGATALAVQSLGGMLAPEKAPVAEEALLKAGPPSLVPRGRTLPNKPRPAPRRPLPGRCKSKNTLWPAWPSRTSCRRPRNMRRPS